MEGNSHVTSTNCMVIVTDPMTENKVNGAAGGEVGFAAAKNDWIDGMYSTWPISSSQTIFCSLSKDHFYWSWNFQYVAWWVFRPIVKNMS